MATDKRIFLSHASADKALADLFRNTLILGGVPEARLFYSSDRATGIPAGREVGSHLQKTLRTAALVIGLISQTFLTRPMCLMELGGAWALTIPTYPIVVPPLTPDQAGSSIGHFQMGTLDKENAVNALFDELHDRLAKEVGISVSLPAWSRAVAAFKIQAPSILETIQAAAEGVATVPKDARRRKPPNSDQREVITFSNPSVTSGRLGRQLHTEATNNDTVPHTAMVRATFYNTAGEIVGTVDGVVNQLEPGSTKTLTLDDVPEHVRRRIQVDTLI